MFSCPFVPQLTEFLAPSKLEDGYAKASSLLGSFILVLFAILVSTTTYVGYPIQCVIPQTYSVEWAQYAESTCLRGITYFLRYDQVGIKMIPPETKQANSTMFYAYISMAFAACAVLSLAPKIVFQMLLKSTKVPLERLATKASEAQKEWKEMRAEKVKEMVEIFYKEIVTRRKKTFGCWNVRTVLLISKVLYFLSTVVQFWLLTVFLHFTQDPLWGWNLTYNIWIGRTWMETGVFPRIVFCDVEIGRNIPADWQFDAIQCHLGVNNINELLCTFLWWWYCILAVFTMIGFLEELLNCDSIAPLKKVMRRASTMRGKKMKLREFAKFLTPNGVFVFQFLERISDRVAYEMAVKLWEKYESDRQDRNVGEESSCLLGCSEVSVAAVDETSL